MKRVALALVAGILIAGCANKSPQKPDFVEVSDEVVKTKLDQFFKDCTQANSAQVCKEMADEIYSTGDFRTASIAYDMVCAGFQYIPACTKLADMFVNGESVPKDPQKGRQIYQIACNKGDTPSCQKAEELKEAK